MKYLLTYNESFGDSYVNDYIDKFSKSINTNCELDIYYAW